MNAFVVSGLIECRAELAGDLEGCHVSLRQSVLDVENLGPTILQFEPDFRLETIKPKAIRRSSRPGVRSCPRYRHQKKLGGFQ